MSKICGIELKASEAILVLLEINGDSTTLIDIEPRKIKLGDDESTAQVKSFFDSFVNFVRDNNVETLVVKKRAKKGQMAGGAISFKLEALIQLNGVANVEFVSGQESKGVKKVKGSSIILTGSVNPNYTPSMARPPFLRLSWACETQ